MNPVRRPDLGGEDEGGEEEVGGAVLPPTPRPLPVGADESLAGRPRIFESSR